MSKPTAKPTAPASKPAAEHWYAETPILVEALAAAVHTTVPDVCEHLEANVTEAGDEPDHAVLEFIDEYIAA